MTADLRGYLATAAARETDHERADRLDRELGETLRVVAVLLDALGGDYGITPEALVARDGFEVVRTDAINGFRLRLRAPGDAHPEQVDALVAELTPAFPYLEAEETEALARYVLRNFTRNTEP